MANLKTTDLPANTTPASTDVFAMVDDPGGTPADNKMTFASLLTLAMQPAATLTAGKALIGNGTNSATISAATGVAHLASGALTGSNVVLTSEVTGVLPVANFATGTPTGLKFVRDDGVLAVPAGGGAVVQVVNTQTGAAANGTTTIPFDNTIPQKTEGDEYMTLAITPTNSTHKLKIDVVFVYTNSDAVFEIVGVFQDTTANALAAATGYIAASTAGAVITFTHYMTAGTTSSTTFKVRAGGHVAGTTYFNSHSSFAGGLLGGVIASSITITEIVP